MATRKTSTRKSPASVSAATKTSQKSTSTSAAPATKPASTPPVHAHHTAAAIAQQAVTDSQKSLGLAHINHH